MNEPVLHTDATIALFVLAGVTLVAVIGVVAPYGRHDRAGWGPKISSRLGWIVMESPASLLFAAIYFPGQLR